MPHGEPATRNKPVLAIVGKNLQNFAALITDPPPTFPVRKLLRRGAQLASPLPSGRLSREWLATDGTVNNEWLRTQQLECQERTRAEAL